jgi:hypothetical protein
MARPKKQFDEKEWAQFEALCGIMCTQDEICGVLKVSDKTLGRLVKEKYKCTFGEAYSRFSSAGRASLRRAQFRLAQKNATMAIFLGKVYLKQRENDLESEDVEDTDALFGEIENG